MKSISSVIIYILRGVAISMILAGSLPGYGNENLPKVIILGKQYYCYESKKGDSLFGIANKYGWDTTTLNELNPNISSPLAKGTLIYYPVSDNDITLDSASDNVISERVTHLIQSGETIYGISRAYDIPVDQLYALNPGARNGIKAGETLIISEQREISIPKEESATIEVDSDITPLDLSNDSKYVYHNVQNGETLYSIAVKYDTRVEDIYRLNPGVIPSLLRVGETLRIMPGTRSSNVRSEMVTEHNIVSIDTYKVQKGDTWGSISASLGIDTQDLRDANPGKWKLKKGDVIAVPHTEDVEVEHSYVEIDPREQSPEGLRELYDEVHSIETSQYGVPIEQKEVKVAIILEDTSSNRDMEFSRGALLGVDRLKNRNFKTSVMILDGSVPMSKTLTQLETFGPDLMISTSDKGLPQYLIDYSQRTSTELVNSFDVKNESYLDTPTVYQFMTPSSYFNDSVMDFINDRYGDRELIITGQISNGDNLGELLSNRYAGRSKSIPASEIGSASVNDLGKYLIYCTPTKQKDVEELFEEINKLCESNPLADIMILGRANWVTFGNKLSDKFNLIDFIIPSRFYFDPTDVDSRRFINDYQQMFGQTPVKSYPVYSVVGYDLVTYFLPNIVSSNGDYNRRFNSANTLQSDLDIERVSNWSGMYNPSCYILDYSMPGAPAKIAIPINK
ncbi:MAG: LysM peptidoglycan-binding domain-containing protein [Muribaculaceae bacterium]|nr:LysM peptidoglycan-binding domain-containing protein [Muribaculaceae bacterium]